MGILIDGILCRLRQPVIVDLHHIEKQAGIHPVKLAPHKVQYRNSGKVELGSYAPAFSFFASISSKPRSISPEGDVSFW